MTDTEKKLRAIIEPQLPSIAEESRVLAIKLLTDVAIEVVLMERERCAKICEHYAQQLKELGGWLAAESIRKCENPPSITEPVVS